MIDIKRWLMPISGELRAGGDLPARGQRGRRDPHLRTAPLLKVTFGGPTSFVEVRLTARGDSDTVLELEHTVPIEMAQSGDRRAVCGTRVGRCSHGAGTVPARRGGPRPGHSGELPAGAGVLLAVGAAWAEVVKDSGTSTAEQVVAATEASLAQFAPDPANPQNQQTKG